MSDFKGSSSIESDSDQIWMLHRPFKAMGDKTSTAARTLEDRVEWMVEKNREGETGMVPYRFMGSCFRFEKATDQDLNRWREVLSVKERKPGK